MKKKDFHIILMFKPIKYIDTAYGFTFERIRFPDAESFVIETATSIFEVKTFAQAWFKMFPQLDKVQILGEGLDDAPKVLLKREDKVL